MKVVSTPRAERALKKIPKARTLLLEFIEFAALDDWWKSSKLKKLTGTDFFRYKSGNYRIIFNQEGEILAIFDIRKRDEKTYKNL